MPPRLVRRQESGHLHFITFSCHGRNPFLNTSSAISLFLSALESRRLRYQFKIIGYVIMPEHVHLLITEPPEEPLSKAIGSLKREVSRFSPEKPFWLPRYYDFNVFAQNKRIERLRYIHRNPVHRALCLTPEGYPWSSFRHYALHEPGPESITIA